MDMLNQSKCIGALDLIAINEAWAIITNGALIAGYFNIVITFLGLVVHPIRYGWAADNADFFIAMSKQDGISNNIAIRVAADDLLCLVFAEVFQGVDRNIGKKSANIGSLKVNVGHMKWLIKQDDTFLPGFLFIAPVAILGGKGEVVTACLRIAQHVYWACERL